MAANYAITGYGVIGLNVQVAQGDSRKTFYYPSLDIVDFDNLKLAIEASTEYTVLGFAPVYRSDAYIDGTLTVVEGTADLTPFVKCGIKRTFDTGNGEIDMKTLYVPLPISSDSAKALAVKTALNNKTLGGAKVTDVFRQSAQTIGS